MLNCETYEQNTSGEAESNQTIRRNRIKCNQCTFDNNLSKQNLEKQGTNVNENGILENYSHFIVKGKKCREKDDTLDNLDCKKFKSNFNIQKMEGVDKCIQNKNIFGSVINYDIDSLLEM